ncbi:MAG: COX15/CtaA family protein [Balneolaceae bacterium]
MKAKTDQQLKTWYWSGAALVFLILIIGGITRLTGSGLSMTDWKPIMGSIPPISESQWEDAFDKYKQFPEYQERNSDMNLAEFQVIFFWEYLHRMLGRLLGLVFLVPFAWFLIRRKFSRKQFLRSTLLLMLGLGQGLMGWFMVQSGLIDVPEVSHYRLAAHLLLAFIIFGCCVWFALDINSTKRVVSKSGTELKTWLNIFIVILLLQVIWGAFTAGLHAGHIYNSFPKMYQFWIPPEMFLVEPLILNFFENMTAVQWVHRVLGTVLGVMVIVMWGRTLRLDTSKNQKKWMLILFGAVLLQYAAGVFTLIYHVPVWLGVFHQAMAMVLFGVALAARHRARHQVAPTA